MELFWCIHRRQFVVSVFLFSKVFNSFFISTTTSFFTTVVVIVIVPFRASGAILAACLIPQITRMAITRSARDISYIYMVFFIIGLSLMTFYLVNVGAKVGWITIMVELCLAVTLFLLKILLDFLGPNKLRKGSRHQLGISSRARLELNQFLTGMGGAPFPLMQSDLSHTASHLLLDCQLRNCSLKMKQRPKGSDSITCIETTDLENAHGASAYLSLSESTARENSGEKANESPAFDFRTLADRLEKSLNDAGIQTQRKYMQSFPSFTGRLATEDTIEPTSPVGQPPTMCLIPCKDGYVTMMWYSISSSLAVDFVAAVPDLVGRMNSAASMFCGALELAHPGTLVEASVIGRLPVDLRHLKDDKTA